MPFKSKAQMRYLHKTEPGVAAEFGRSMNEDTIKHLPERADDMKSPKSMRYSDKDVKKNVEGAGMDLDTFVRSGVLERLLEDLKQIEFDNKVKPKMSAELVGTDGGYDVPPEDLEMAEAEEEGMLVEEVPPDEAATDGMPGIMTNTAGAGQLDPDTLEPIMPSPAGMEDEDGMDPRLAKMIREKRKG